MTPHGQKIQPIAPLGPLNALFDTESISALLNRSDDALRESDLAAGYYVPAQTFGNLVPQLKQPRKWLNDRGFSFQLSYKGEGIANIGGGIRRGMDYAHEVTLVTRFDLGRLTHADWLEGWFLHGVLVERAGNQVSHDYVGERRILLSEVYSLSGSVAAHLADIYLEKSFFRNRVNINVGRLTLTHTYATSVLLCTFIIQCSAPVGVKSQSGWSVYPKATWGGTIRIRPTRDLTLRTGVYASGVLTDNPSGWAWGAEHQTGVMLPIELTWEPFFGRVSKLPGHYKLGFGHDTSSYDNLIGTVPAQYKADVGHLSREARDTFYFEADQMIYRSGGEHQMAGGYLLAGYIHNTPNVSVFSDQVYVGMSLLGIIPHRPFDRFGFMYSYYQVSSALRRGQRLRQMAGMSMGAFVNDPQTHSETLEAYYGIPVIPGLIFQPVFEYMMHPGQTKKIPNATLAGLKILASL
ncbi:carbohydrate porin [Acetobacter sp. AN02]|uniref:carbohydrate porin n=1 Tax=Acetobacter sp. AN02 TaxID=2894186 RepID=UPI00243441EC|nr:carbohydrate porin [Acetobacter sp. AN02]MDG6094862.1 carbohydrate porin [Acetobacter sp. AN02]